MLTILAELINNNKTRDKDDNRKINDSTLFL